jgi:hypothetical protein
MPAIPHARSLAFTALALAGLAAGLPAEAAIGEKARAVVARYVEATGGTQALAGDCAVHARGRLRSFALKGTFEQWSQVPDRIATRVSLGPMRLRTGFDGTVGWLADLDSNRVRILDGRELEKLRSDAWFENEMWAREGYGGGTIAYASMLFRDGDTFHVLDVTPPVGPSRRLMFSEKTGLLVRVVTRFDHHESDYWLSEYKMFGARKRPTVQAAVEGAAAFRGADLPERIQIDSLWVNGPIDTSVFAAPGSRDSRVTWLKSAGLARIPFRYGGHHVWIKVSNNGSEPGDFILDTGASGTAIDREFAERIGLAQEGLFEVQGMGGSDVGAFASVRTLRVSGTDGDGVSIPELKASVIDLSNGHEEVLWRRLDGLIGYDVLGRFVVQVDYDRQVVTLRDPATFVPERAGEAIPMRLLAGIPIITVQLDGGCEGEFLVDTGNAFGMLVHGSLVEQCRVFARVGHRRQVKIHGGGVGSGFASWLCRLDTLRLGGFTVLEPLAGLSLARHGMVGSQHYGGNLGSAMLERFVCTFDYARKTLYLAPGRRFAQRDRYSRVGAFFLRTADRVTAVGIVRGSPAEEAGLESEDAVLEIDGRKAAAFTPEDMDRIFVDGEPGATHTLTIERDGVTRRISITLRDVI